MPRPGILVRTALASVAAALVLLLAACGSSGGAGSDAGADPATIAPVTTPVYIEASVHPQGAQKSSAEAILKKILNKPDPGAEIQRLLDQAGKKDGVTYQKDIEPWLGDRVGITLVNIAKQSPDAAVIAPATDPEAARAALRKGSKTTERSYNGVQYDFDSAQNDASTVVDGYAVAGDEPAVKAVIDASKSADKGLASSSRYQDALKTAPSDRLGIVYVDLQRIVESSRVPAQEQGILRQFLGGANVRPVVVAMQAQPDGVAFESHARSNGALAGVGGRTVPLLAQLPEDSWLALGVADVGKSVRQGIDLVSKLGVPGLTPETLRLGLRSQTGLDLDRDLLDWIGDMAFFVRGTSAKDVGGGVVIASSDPGASQRAIERIGALVKKQASGATKVSGSGADLTVTDPSLPEPVRIVARGDKVVIAYGEAATRAALAPAGKLGDSSAFKQAEGSLGAGVTPSGFVSIPAIVKLAESSTTADPSFTKARPYLDAFSNIAFGSRRDGADVVSRFVVGVK